MLNIKPNKEWEIIGTFDKIKSQDFINMAMVFPSQQKINFEEIVNELVPKLIQYFYRGKIIVDLLIDENKNIHFLNIDASFSDLASGYYLFDFLIEGQ